MSPFDYFLCPHFGLWHNTDHIPFYVYCKGRKYPSALTFATTSCFAVTTLVVVEAANKCLRVRGLCHCIWHNLRSVNNLQMNVIANATRANSHYQMRKLWFGAALANRWIIEARLYILLQSNASRAATKTPSILVHVTALLLHSISFVFMCGKRRSEVDEHRDCTAVPYYGLLVFWTINADLDVERMLYRYMYWRYLRATFSTDWCGNLGVQNLETSIGPFLSGRHSGTRKRSWNNLVMRHWNFVRSFFVRTPPRKPNGQLVNIIINQTHWLVRRWRSSGYSWDIRQRLVYST